jgi:hypothetical protein
VSRALAGHGIVADARRVRHLLIESGASFGGQIVECVGWNAPEVKERFDAAAQPANALPRCGVPTVVSDCTRSHIPSLEIMYRESSPPMLWAIM